MFMKWLNLTSWKWFSPVNENINFHLLAEIDFFFFLKNNEALSSSCSSFWWNLKPKKKKIKIKTFSWYQSWHVGDAVEKEERKWGEER